MRTYVRLLLPCFLIDLSHEHHYGPHVLIFFFWFFCRSLIYLPWLHCLRRMRYRFIYRSGKERASSRPPYSLV